MNDLHAHMCSNPEGIHSLSEGLRVSATLVNGARKPRTLKGFSRKAAFTLIEMLTVLAITAVLLTIIVLPVFQSFNLTRAAQAFADAQAQGRFLTEKIAREIGESVSVRPTNNQIPTSLNGNAQNLPNSSVIVQMPAQPGQTTPILGPSGYLVEVVLPYTKLDLIPPAQGQDPNDIGPAGSGFKDPVSGKFDPTLKAPKGQFATPVVPSMSLVRYAVGLRNPFAPYVDPYSGLLMSRSGTRDNLYVLYRMVAVPYLLANNGVKEVNTALFPYDPGNSANNPVPTIAILDDPRFMVPDWNSATNPPSLAQDDHNLRIYHWLGQYAPWEPQNSGQAGYDPVKDNMANFAHSVIQTEVSRYDMVAPQYNQASQKVYFDTINGLSIPRLTPMVQFRPTLISNDPTAGQEALRPGEESDSAPMIGPDTYKTEYGLWNNAVVRTFPAGFNRSNANTDSYVMGYTGLNGAPGFSEYAYNPASGGEFTSGFEFFDTFTYNSDLSVLGRYPFTDAAYQANLRSGWMSQPGVFSQFLPYNVLSGPGKIVASFDISEVGVTSLPSDSYEDANRPNLPTLWLQGPVPGDTGYQGPYSVTNDPDWNASTNTWSGAFPWSPLTTTLWTPVNYTVANPYDMNEAFNQTWYTYKDLQSGLGVQRFIDLRVLQNEDGTYGPLYPATAGQGPTASPTGFEVSEPDGSVMNRCHIVPGSEIVYGPDQKPGPNYGHLIRYSRTTHAPGPDQYKINYTDQREPEDPGNNNQVTANAYQNQLGLTPAETAGFNPDVYDPTNFCSAQIQPRFKVGYLQLNSDPNLPLPNGYYTTPGNTSSAFVPVPFQVEYRFQFTGTIPAYIANQLAAGTGTTDVFDVDYDTRQLMQVLLTIRNYPQSNLPNPQSVTLKSTASIRNLAH